MEQNEMHQLREEMALLRQQMATIKETQDNDFDELNKLIKEVYTSSYQLIDDIYDLLWPVVHKLFPDFARNKRQINRVLKGAKKSEPGQGKAP